MLFIPGSDHQKLEKIPTLSAAALLLDLEDGVAATAKASARTNLEGLPREAATTHRIVGAGQQPREWRIVR